MEPAEATSLIDATRDDLVRDVLAMLSAFGLRRLTPQEIEELGRVVIPHIRAGALVGTRYEQEKLDDDEPTRVAPVPEQGWVSEKTPGKGPHSRRPRAVKS